MALFSRRDLDRQITIQRPVPNTDPDGAGSGTWATVATDVWAQIQDLLPSRGGKTLSDGIDLSVRPARVRMRYRADVTPDMRFVTNAPPLQETVGPSTPRVMTITAGPAELGRFEGLEFLVKDYSISGNGS
jgi:head-tail adaptor